MSEQSPFVTYEDTSPADADEPGTHEAESDDLATLLQRREHARPTRLTWVLLTLLVLTAGFIGGAFAGQRLGNSTSSGNSGFTMPAGMPTSFPSGALFPGAAGGGAAPSGTTGTVKLVDGRNLYLTDSSGNTVKVIVPSTVTVTSQQAVDLADLAAGATVLVDGETGADGTVTATSVAEGGTSTSTSTATPRTASDQPSPSPSAQGAN